jgi:HK97 gp10 family phage protein
MIRIDTNELDKFAVEVSKLSDKTEENVKKVLKNSAFNIEANAKKNLSSNKSVVTGHLRRGITTDIKGLEATIHTSNIKYAPMVEYGTKAHIIKAKNKKALYWKGAKHPVKSVRHPGSEAKPYLIPAFEKEKDTFVKNLEEVIKW